MTVYVCLDDRNGMQFNHRRQSRDAEVFRDILSRLPAALTIDPFSQTLMQSAGIPWGPAPEDLAQLAPDAHFFLEDRTPSDVVPFASTVIIYRWNRHYPADLHWDVDLTEAGFSLREVSEFAGKSHEKITREVYTR